MKRKERNDDGEVASEYHGSTFFVSNLPYNASSTDLQTLFSEIEPGATLSWFVRYASFAIREDAQAAFDQIPKEGLTLVGRKLRIQWAEQKMHDNLHTKIRKHKGAEKLEWPVSGDDGIQDSSSGAIRGVFARPSCIKPRAAHAVFSTPALALDAVNKLHAVFSP
ncbi:hypothetical protein F5887DRAFT_994843 [Amanita rubescens]|nr:hypothetical protein F5887DRAFT_994843 [Amanita rubescens]